MATRPTYITGRVRRRVTPNLLRSSSSPSALVGHRSRIADERALTVDEPAPEVQKPTPGGFERKGQDRGHRDEPPVVATHEQSQRGEGQERRYEEREITV